MGLGLFLFSRYAGESSGNPEGLPDYVAPMNIPKTNPLTEQKVLLGRHLFYEPRLSVTGTVSCSSCHQQSLAFTDGRKVSPGAHGELTFRNSMTLANAGFNSVFTWADNSVKSLEDQALIPLLNDEPVEMGLSISQVSKELGSDPVYKEMFTRAFPGEESPITIENIVKALASFQRTFHSFDSAYDRYLLGDSSALSESAQRGMKLFFSERLKCDRCHGGYNFRFTIGHRKSDDDQSVAFHNTGLYNIDGSGAYPELDTGLIKVTGSADDMGKFKAPTLRNISLTAPYMHDGSIATLEEVIDHYAAGGREITGGQFAGKGMDSPLKSNLITGFSLTQEEKADLLGFLLSLTDQSFVKEPKFSSPFQDK